MSKQWPTNEPDMRACIVVLIGLAFLLALCAGRVFVAWLLGAME